MSTVIHPSAIIDDSAVIGDGVNIGPFCVIGPNCKIGKNTELFAHVVLEQNVTIGEDCVLKAGVVLGGPPQDHKFKGESTGVIIGDRVQLREYVTIHRATGDGNNTIIGDDNLLMAYVHVGHNCLIGNRNMLSSYAGLAGHVTIEDNVVVGGMVGIHQFVHVGKYAMLGAYSKIVQDVPPFMLADGRPADVLDINAIGLRRSGLLQDDRNTISDAYKLLYRSSMNRAQALEQIRSELPQIEALEYLVAFVERVSKGSAGRQDDRPRR